MEFNVTMRIKRIRVLHPHPITSAESTQSRPASSLKGSLLLAPQVNFILEDRC